MVSFSLRLTNGSLKSSYFLILVLAFQSLVRILYPISKSSRSIYLSPNLVTIYIVDSLIYNKAPRFLSIGVLIYSPNS